MGPKCRSPPKNNGEGWWAKPPNPSLSVCCDHDDVKWALLVVAAYRGLAVGAAGIVLACERRRTTTMAKAERLGTPAALRAKNTITDIYIYIYTYIYINTHLYVFINRYSICLF